MDGLPKWAKLRAPSNNEEQFFRQRGHIGGYAADDNSIVMNPHSKLSEKEAQAVMLNEASRIFMRVKKILPDFDLTPEQMKAFSGYSSNDNDIKSTIVGRILSGDPSAENATPEQMEFAQKIKRQMFETEKIEPDE